MGNWWRVISSFPVPIIIGMEVALRIGHFSLFCHYFMCYKRGNRLVLLYLMRATITGSDVRDWNLRSSAKCVSLIWGMLNLRHVFGRWIGFFPDFSGNASDNCIIRKRRKFGKPRLRWEVKREENKCKKLKWKNQWFITGWRKFHGKLTLCSFGIGEKHCCLVS